jgi:hypothetical protein
MSGAPQLELIGINKRYGATVTAADFSLTIA